MLRGNVGKVYADTSFGYSLRTRGTVWALACGLVAGVCFGQPDEATRKAFEEEAEARKSGKPFAVATDPSTENKIVRGTITTPDSIEFKFTVAAGEMLYVTNKLTGEEFSYVISPNVSRNSKGQEVLQPSNSQDSDDIALRAFRITNFVNLSETSFTALSTKSNEAFTDEAGSHCTLAIQGIFARRPAGGVVRAGTCCVSCGTYQICGETVTSSCGSCSASGGPGANNKDVP